MNDTQTLYTSPELHPLEIDFANGVMTFVRIPPSGYLQATFLGSKAAMRVATGSVSIRLDDVLFAAAASPRQRKRVHYVLHTAYCCSTLLARYFELIPSCFVLKEPQLLSQLATAPQVEGMPRFSELLDACIRLLTRTYRDDQLVLIKPNVPCNFLATQLLEQDSQATITFLFTEMRRFILAVLKSDLRRGRIRSWNRLASRVAVRFPRLSHIRPARLHDAEAAAYSWLVNRLWCEELHSSHAGRIIAADGDQLASAPESSLRAIMNMCGLPSSTDAVAALVGHPSVHHHSKHLEHPYDGAARAEDINLLDDRYALEADGAVEWSLSLGFNESELSARLGMGIAESAPGFVSS